MPPSQQLSPPAPGLPLPAAGPILPPLRRCAATSPCLPTIVTAFFDAGREDWPVSARPLATYLGNCNRTLSLSNPMVIFTEPRFVGYMRAARAAGVGHEGMEASTMIVPLEIGDLPAARHYAAIDAVMRSSAYLEGHKGGGLPEYSMPLYSVIIWSKTALVADAIAMEPFGSSHFLWVDAGMHTHMLPDQLLGQPFPPLGAHMDRFLASSSAVRLPALTRLRRADYAAGVLTFTKAHVTRLSASNWGGAREPLLAFHAAVWAMYDEWLAIGTVDSEQTAYTWTCYRWPALCDVYHVQGKWARMMTDF
jgi:hypothetical protein